MEFKLKFNMDNESFDNFPESEICTILDSVKNKIADGHVFGKIRNVSGNTIGEWVIDE
jgi:hypothetical protein